MRPKRNQRVPRAFRKHGVTPDSGALPTSDEARELEAPAGGDPEVDIPSPPGDVSQDESGGSVGGEEETEEHDDGLNRPAGRSALVRELAPVFHKETLREMLLSLDREPFVDLLTMFMGAHPDPEKVYDFANRNPYQWAQAVNLLGKMSGYTEKHEVDLRGSVLHLVKQASDMELEDRYREIQKQLEHTPAEPIPAVISHDTDVEIIPANVTE